MNHRGVVRSIAAAFFIAAVTMMSAAIHAQSGATVLTAPDAQKLLPSSLFYAGQTASTQLRNSGGIKFPGGKLVLATLVDTSGYSTALAEKYQGQLLTEVPIEIEGKRLPAGVYGIGFVGGNKFIVTDIGGHDVLTVNSSTDAALKRPRPLQILTGSSNDFRLYCGRSYVTLTR